MWHKNRANLRFLLLPCSSLKIERLSAAEPFNVLKTKGEMVTVLPQQNRSVRRNRVLGAIFETLHHFLSRPN